MTARGNIPYNPDTVYFATPETPAAVGRDPRAEFAAGIARAESGFLRLRADLLLLVRQAHFDLEERRTTLAAELPAAALADVQQETLRRVLEMEETVAAIGRATGEIRRELLPRLRALGEEAFAALADPGSDSPQS